MCASLQTAYGELRDSEQRFRDYAEMASDWLWATDREHRLTFLSEHSGAFGYDWGKLIGKHRWEFAADFTSDPEKWREHIAILERREPFRDFVYENRRTDGSPGIISVSGKPAFDAEGRFSGYRGVASDLTERKRAEAVLREREAKIRRLVDANIIGIYIAEVEGRIVEANDAFLRMVGYDRGDLASGRISWTDLTPPEWGGRDEQAVSDLKMIGSVQPYEKEYFREDGTRVPVLIGVASIDEGARRNVVFVLDLTARKRAEAALGEMQMQLAHANRVATMGQLAASIAHEVNQPIAATVTNAQAALRWLGAEPPNLDEVQQALVDIVRTGNRAGDVVGRIRNLSKKATPRDERVEINAAIREVIELARSEAMKSGVLVQTKLVEGLPLVQGDRVELQQVILNLILNAVEAMSELSEGSRELLIATGKTESGDVLVAVRDSGPGLAPAARLFEAFHTTKPNGLGLGLSICRSIIEAHGGRLWASANTPRGAVFQFTLPVSRDVATRQ